MWENLLRRLALICICLALCHSNYVENRVVALPQGIFQVDYSPKQVFLGAAAPSMFVLYTGHTGRELQRINIDPTLALISFTFSQDNNWLALGLNDGSAHLYKYNANTKAFEDTAQSYQGQVQSDVTGICFTPDNNYLVIGVQSDTIAVWDLNQDLSVQINFDTQLVLTVSCSPKDSKFVVGGGQNTNTQLVLFQLDFQTGNVTINRVHKFDDSTNSTPFGTTFSADGASVYSVGRNTSITVFNVTSYQKTSVPVEGLTEQLKKIRVSEDGSVIAVVTNTVDDYKIFVVNNTQLSQSQLQVVNLSRRMVEIQEARRYSMGLNAVEQISTIIPSVALAPKAENIFFVSAANTGTVGGVCEQNYYVDSQNSCLACNQNCTICQSSASECFQCHAARYLSPEKLCLQCIVGCLDCEDGDSCTQCDTDAHFILNDTDNQCVCQPAFFRNAADECQDCVEGCLECDNAQTCITCDISKGFIQQAGKCVCAPGFYNKDGVCETCIRGCEICTDDTTCNTCFQNDHYIPGPNNTCVCDEPEHFIDDGENCVCEVGYYLDSELNKCEKCRLGCSQCSAADVCTACIAGLHIDNNVCVCDDAGDYIDPGTQTCKPCIDVLDFCEACVSANECTQCQAGLDRHLQNGACPCDDGFYPDATKVCLACQQLGCKKCTGPEACLECDGGDHWTLNDTTGQCQCQDDYVQQNATCVNCPDGCKVCDDVDLSCLECEVNWELDGQGGCQCVSGYYEQDKTCLQCMAGCLNCTQLDICLTCDVDNRFVLDDQTNSCVCLAGYYIDVDQRQCLSCATPLPNCVQCSSANKCTKCANPFKLTNTGRCGCDKGKYVDNKKCSDCEGGCLDCTGPEQCTECDDSHTLDGGVCKEDGLDTLIIVLIVIGALAAGGAVFALVKCVKKKRQALPDEDYEELG